jgi:hypothetical protein
MWIKAKRLNNAATAPAAWLDSAFEPRLFEPLHSLPFHWGTVHWNVATNLTPDQHGELFFDAIIEGLFRFRRRSTRQRVAPRSDLWIPAHP